MQRILTATRGLAAMIALLAVTVGMPWLLVTTVGNPYPPEGLSFSGRLTDSAILGMLAVIGWIVWAQLVVCVVIEVVVEIRVALGRSAAWMTTVPGTFGGQQQLVRMLVQAVVTAAVGAGVTANPIAGSTIAVAVAASTHVEEPAPVAAAPARVGSVTPRHVTQPWEITVVKGDTLWSLAERHLGAGEKWREIADLNLGRAMGDGQEFSYAGTIQPGWGLLVPGSPAREPASDAATVVVERGDTLWRLAEERYGDGMRWPRLYDANRQQVADPDVIYPGQVLDVPGQRQHPVAPRSGSRASEERHEPPPRATPGPPQSDVPPNVIPEQSEVEPRADAGHEHAADSEERVEGSSLAAALTGGGALLGAGLLSFLLARRRTQYRRRRSGRMVARTPADLTSAEAALRTGGAEGIEDADHLDLALRGLVDAVRARDGIITLPDVIAARLGDDKVDLHLGSHYRPTVPSPWRKDESGLVLTRSREAPLAESDSLAPYPTLVTVGTDETGATWLVDLEAAGIVHLAGDPDVVDEVALFLVTELGVNVWSDHVAVGVGEFASPLVNINPDRIRVCDRDPIRELVEAVYDVVDSSHVTGQDVLAGRLDGSAAEVWMPRITVIPGSEAVTDHELDLLCSELDHPPGRKAVALVVVGGDKPIDQASLRLTVHHDGWMSIEPLGVKVKANRVSREAARQVAALFAHHHQAEDEPMLPAAGDQPFEHVSDAAGAFLAEHTAPRDSEGAIESLLPLTDKEYVQAAATTSDDLAVLAPRIPQQLGERVLAIDPTLDADLAAWHDPETTRPRIRMLGPVELMVAVELTGDANNRRAYATEVVAHLVTHPRGVTTEQLACEFDVKGNVVHNYMAAARKWVGIDPNTGKSHIPDCTKTEAGRKRGMGVYQIVGVLSDENLFRRLRVRAQARGPEGIDDLVAALRLVEGRPFEQLRKRGYGWLAETPLDHQLTAAIVDVAHIVATHCLATGDPETARWAAEKAIRAAPAEEKPKLDLAAAVAASGDPDLANRYLADEVHNRSDDGGAPPDMHARTREVLQATRSE